MGKWYNPEEKAAFVASYKQSGLSIREYSRIVGVSQTSMCRWLELYGDDPEILKSLDNIPVNFEGLNAERNMRIKCGDFQIDIPLGCSRQDIQAVLRAIKEVM